MIEVLPDHIPGFPGAANHTRCFNHIVALVAVRIVRQFDVASGENKEAMDEAEQELQDLAEGLDIEEAVTQREREAADDEDDEDNEGDDVSGWNEERAKMSVADHDELDESTRPVRMLLIKVSSRILLRQKDSHIRNSFEKYLLR